MTDFLKNGYIPHMRELFLLQKCKKWVTCFQKIMNKPHMKYFDKLKNQDFK